MATIAGEPENGDADYTRPVWTRLTCSTTVRRNTNRIWRSVID